MHKLTRSLTLSLLMGVVALSAQAQNMAIKGAAILDVTTGELHSGRIVLVKNGRIARVAPAGEVTIPAGSDVLDLQGHTLLPGLIDMHVHLTSGGAQKS